MEGAVGSNSDGDDDGNGNGIGTAARILVWLIVVWVGGVGGRR